MAGGDPRSEDRPSFGGHPSPSGSCVVDRDARRRRTDLALEVFRTLRCRGWHAVARNTWRAGGCISPVLAAQRPPYDRAKWHCGWRTNPKLRSVAHSSARWACRRAHCAESRARRQTPSLIRESIRSALFQVDGDRRLLAPLFNLGGKCFERRQFGRWVAAVRGCGGYHDKLKASLWEQSGWASSLAARGRKLSYAGSSNRDSSERDGAGGPAAANRKTSGEGVHVRRKVAGLGQDEGMEERLETRRRREFPLARLEAYVGILASPIGYADARTAATGGWRSSVMAATRGHAIQGKHRLAPRDRCAATWQDAWMLVLADDAKPGRSAEILAILHQSLAGGRCNRFVQRCTVLSVSR